MFKRRLSFKSHFDLFLLGIYILISGIFLAFSTGGFVVNFRDIGFSLMSGAQKGLFSVTSFFSGTVNAVQELSELKQRYRELTVRLEDYELLQRTNADISTENEKLKELIGFRDSITTKNIPAEIIGRDPNNMYSGIIINRGAKHGIKKDMPVIAFQGNYSGLVGKVVQVGRSTSMIMPIYDYQCFIASRLETTRYEGLISGQGSTETPLLMKYVKKRAKEEIKVGDQIVTSGENRLYPKNIPIGFVSRIRGLDYETSLELDIEPVIDFSRLENIFVLDLGSAGGEEN